MASEFPLYLPCVFEMVRNWLVRDKDERVVDHVHGCSTDTVD